jgi:hypothetical protein
MECESRSIVYRGIQLGGGERISQKKGGGKEENKQKGYEREKKRRVMYKLEPNIDDYSDYYYCLCTANNKLGFFGIFFGLFSMKIDTSSLHFY